ncbi:MAG: hypothetical protein K6C40_05895 [Thermoguttaceae bacterium]|nr:hypothetical protein [Thermoguttaceae bacterium]
MEENDREIPLQARFPAKKRKRSFFERGLVGSETPEVELILLFLKKKSTHHPKKVFHLDKKRKI